MIIIMPKCFDLDFSCLGMAFGSLLTSATAYSSYL